MTPRRIAAAGALIAVVVLVGIVMLGGGGGGYTIHAQFQNAGRLVDGGQVRIAGRSVGKITAVDLADNGLADVTLSIGDSSAAPLPRGTTAAIRSVGAATLTNNFVELQPGSNKATPLADGAVLPADHNRGIVDLDAILSSLDPKARSDIRAFIGRSADVFSGSGSRNFNAMLAQLDPAFAQLRGVTDQLASDRARIGDFVKTTSLAATKVASRRPDLEAAVENTATTLGSIADERAALAGTLEHAPAVFEQGGKTFDALATTMASVRPALREATPAGKPLDSFLGEMQTFLPRARPVAGQLTTQLPQLGSALRELPALRRPAVAALESTGTAFKDSKHILRGLRFYAPDALVGILNGLLTIGAGNYNKYGHYMHISFVQTPQDTLGTIFAGALAKNPLIPGLFDIRQRLLRPCPGGAAPPAPDGSSPWIPDRSLCNPEHNMPASVNVP